MQPHLLRKKLSAPPVAGLDTHFLRAANRRLGLVSAAFAGAVATLVLVTLLLYGPLGWPAPEHLPHFLAAQSALFLVSLAMATVVRSGRLQPVTVVSVGLVYQVGGALIIPFCVFQGDMLLQPVMVSLSWLAVWILLFPLFVPGPPLRSGVVSLICATTAPAVFLTWSYLHGQPLPTVPVLAETFVPYYVCAGLAVIPAWLVYDLGAMASAAREQASRLGSYELVERLGSGGMGEVWHAEHALLARSAAIKLIRPEREDAWENPAVRAEVLARFEREAKATAALTSPHTVSLFDYGITDDGTLYYAMELLDGLDLETLVQRFGPVPPARAVHLLRQACDSLAEAHEAGLVHRDVKPANLVACRIGGKLDFLKVLDFGLVRSSSSRRSSADPTVSDHDFVVGTPAFMAPELATAPERVDGRADIYALGCAAYWLLTGELVYELTNPAQMIADHINRPPPPPSIRAEQEIPPELERLILDCLEKDPAQRPESASALERRLAALALAEPWTQQDAGAWWRDHAATLRDESDAVADLTDQLPEHPSPGESAAADPARAESDPDDPTRWPDSPVRLGAGASDRIAARRQVQGEGQERKS